MEDYPRFRKIERAFDTYDLDKLKEVWSPEVANTCYSAVGHYLIHSACIDRREDAIRFMLENGANPNVITHARQQTPLLLAHWCRHRNERAVNILILKYGGNPYMKGLSGNDAFSICVQRETSIFESYLMVELVCGEADYLHVDLWRVVKPFIYNI